MRLFINKTQIIKFIQINILELKIETNFEVYITNLDKRTPSSTNGFLAFNLRNVSDLADNKATRTHSLAEPFLFSFIILK